MNLKAWAIAWFFTLILGLMIGKILAIYLGNDNNIEQAMEEVVKQQTGLSVDFTPEGADSPPPPKFEGMNGATESM